MSSLLTSKDCYDTLQKLHPEAILAMENLLKSGQSPATIRRFILRLNVGPLLTEVFTGAAKHIKEVMDGQAVSVD